jgi:hypothetical protein
MCCQLDYFLVYLNDVMNIDSAPHCLLVQLYNFMHANDIVTLILCTLTFKQLKGSTYKAYVTDFR